MIVALHKMLTLLSYDAPTGTGAGQARTSSGGVLEQKKYCIQSKYRC